MGRFFSGMSVSWRDLLVYKLDRILSGHPAGRLLVLGVVACVTIVLTSALRFFATGEGVGLALWWAIIATLDPVKFAEEETYSAILVGVLASLCGLVVVASLIGLINSSIEERLELLQKGRSPVIASGHVLILNWTQEKVLAILRELAIASRCRSTASKTVVLLSEAEKSQVEDVVYSVDDITSHLDVVVRTGSPSSPGALLIAGASRATCVIALNPDLDPSSSRFGESDREIVKTLLALRKTAPRVNVVAELCNTEQLPILPSIFRGQIDPVIMGDTLARILVQTSLSKGLSEVLADLLTFEGSELYFREIPQFDGLAFGEAQWRLYDAIPVGYARLIDGERKVFLNPPLDHVLRSGDQVLILSESGHSFSIGPARHVPARSEQVSAAVVAKKIQRHSECICVIGYSSKLSFIVREFDAYMPKGSLVVLVPGLSQGSTEIPALQQDAASLENLQLKILDGRINDPVTLERIVSLDPPPKSIVVIAAEGSDYDDADAQTISTVLLLNIYQRKAQHHVRVICEILDASSKELLDGDVGCDFVLSSEITSRLIAQIALDGKLRVVFEELFTPDGNEIYLKSPLFYCGGHLDQEVSWLDIQARAMKASEIAIGYYVQNRSFLNPKQSGKRMYTEEDRIIVISENEDEISVYQMLV